MAASEPSREPGTHTHTHTHTLTQHTHDTHTLTHKLHLYLRFENRQEFVEAVRQLRLRELSCDHRMTRVRCGLASVIPLQLLSILTPADLDLRVCGVPDVNLDYLRVGAVYRHVLIVCLLLLFVQRHTKYHVGLEETDKHVQFFWNTLESFSQVWCVSASVCVCMCMSMHPCVCVCVRSGLVHRRS